MATGISLLSNPQVHINKQSVSAAVSLRGSLFFNIQSGHCVAKRQRLFNMLRRILLLKEATVGDLRVTNSRDCAHGSVCCTARVVDSIRTRSDPPLLRVSISYRRMT